MLCVHEGVPIGQGKWELGTRVLLVWFILATAGRERRSGRDSPGPSSGLTGLRSLLFPLASPSGWSLKPDFRSSPDVQGRRREVEQMGPGIPVGAGGRRTAAGGCAGAYAGAEVGSPVPGHVSQSVPGTWAESRLGRLPLVLSPYWLLRSVPSCLSLFAGRYTLCHMLCQDTEVSKTDPARGELSLPPSAELWLGLRELTPLSRVQSGQSLWPGGGRPCSEA